MTMTLTEEIKAKLINKAMQDDGFRQELFASPAQAVSDSFGVTIPGGKTLHVLEQTPESLDFIVPQRPGNITENMTENEIIDRLTRDMPKLSDKLTNIISVYGKILSKTWTDPGFLDKFKTDPKAVISEESGTILPENQKIVVRVEDEHNEYLALPMLNADSELTDEELELVSGGLGGLALIIICLALGVMSVSW